MAHRKHRRSSRRTKRGAIVRRTLSEGASIVKNTSKKYMPKVKTGLENVGSKVTTATKSTVPALQQATRKFFSLFGIGKTKKHRKH